MGTEPGSDPESSSNGWSRARGLVVKTLVLIGGALLIKRLTKSTTRRDHARVVSRSLTGEKAFWRTPQKPFRQRLYMVKPCPKELKCDVEVSSYAIRDAEEYKNFCDRPKDQRPLPEEVIGNGASYSISDLVVLKNNEIHLWDRGFDENRNQVWGPKQGPYEFKPATSSSVNENLSALNILYQSSIDKPIQGSLILQD
uniref:Uncharacterized protein n=1 Tax=Boechera stricta TaxID=72658 RepID=K4FQR3_BOEST|nr:hypothetical protein 7G9.10 [Boechera stricta]